MAELKDRVKTALDETRILILGSHVLVGFQFRSIFEPGFEKLPEYSKYMKLGGLGLMIIAVGLLMWPGAFHQIVDDGQDTKNLHRFTTSVMQVALLPFAFGLGIDFFVGGERLMGLTAGLIAGIIASLMALFFWYGLEAMRKGEHALENENMEKQNQDSQEGGTRLKDMIEQVLTEARVVLPGSQALLGFQFASILTEGFEKLPESSKYIHFSSLSLIGLSIILLMTPAAYDRIVEKGAETEHFHRFCSRMVLSAMVPLALGISGDLFVVARKVTESPAFGILASALTVVLFFGMWFGYTMYRRSGGEEERRPSIERNQQAA